MKRRVADGAVVVAVSSSPRKLISCFFFRGVTTGAEIHGRLCIFHCSLAVGDIVTVVLINW